MSKKVHSKYNELLQRFADEYFAETGSESATKKELAVWAVKSGRWDPPKDMILQKCREDFSRALREQYITNDAGQPVRSKHVARITRGDQQLHLWADIRNAPKKHMETAFRQRREQIVGDCRQLKRDVDYYNAKHPNQSKIQLLFDFTDDVEEGEFPDEYPDRRPA